MTRLPPIITPARLPALSLVVAAGILQAACVVAMALVVRDLLQIWSSTATVAEPAAQGPLSRGLPYLLLMVATAICGAGSRWLERVAAERLGQSYAHDVRLHLFDALAVGTAGARATGSGVHMVRFSNDLTSLRNWVAFGVARAANAMLLLAGAILAMALIDVTVASVVALVLLVSLGGLLVAGVRLERTVAQTRMRRGRLANTVAELVDNTELLAAHGRVARERRRLERKSRELGHALFGRAFWIGCLRASADLAHRLVMITALVAGGWAVFHGELSPSALVALASVTALLGMPLRDSARLFEYWKSAAVAKRKLNGVLDPGARALPTARRLDAGPGRLVIESVTFRGIPQIPSFGLEPGRRLAVFGANGSGKSTLLEIISGLRRPHTGRVLLDGTDTAGLSQRDRRRAIGMVSADLPLVAGSVSKNVRFRRPGATAEEVEAACRLAGMRRSEDAVSASFDTRIGRGGRGLSHGERVRVMLARAVLAGPRLLLLDDVFSGLDVAGQDALYDLLRSYAGTVVFATHDEAIAARADLVCTLDADRAVVTAQETPRLLEVRAR